MTLFRLAPLAGALLLMAGCAMTQPSEAEFTQAMQDVQRTYTQSGPDQALASLEQIAQRHPARSEPWSYMARIRFDQERYGEAIVAADEALSREPGNTVAKSVRVVGGLRVALQSLEELRQDSSLAGSARGEALVLANALREQLGQDALFPERQTAQEPPAPPPRRRARPSTPPRPAAAAPQPEAAPQAAPRPQPEAAPQAAPAPARPAAGTAQPPRPAPTPAAPPATGARSEGERAPDPFGSLLAP